MAILVALETLGCKVNQYESSYFLEQLEADGYRTVPFREHADIYIVHSCAVTSKAGFQTRQLLRRAQRLNPQALIVVAGCDAQLDGDRIAWERLATHVLGTQEKMHLLQWLNTPGTLASPCIAVGAARQSQSFHPLPVSQMHSGRTRAFLKVQDGCDAFCSYCVVPYTRGKSRSLPAAEVRAQLDRYLENGYEEVVLTGIHLGQWGRDLAPRQNLVDLLKHLARGPLPSRIRLSSLEPVEWTHELVQAISSSPWVCPHFHVPLQSGDEEILARMHRPYTPDQYANLIHELHLLFPEAAIGADVLVGFPGETEKRFENTFQLISNLPLAYLHVFPFSPRPGTSASRMPGRVAGTELKRRTQLLRLLGDEKRRAFRTHFVGRCVDVLAETEIETGWWQGTSQNYLQVSFPASRPLDRGTLIRTRIRKATPNGMLLGEPLFG